MFRSVSAPLLTITVPPSWPHDSERGKASCVTNPREKAAPSDVNMLTRYTTGRTRLLSQGLEPWSSPIPQEVRESLHFWGLSSAQDRSRTCMDLTAHCHLKAARIPFRHLSERTTGIEPATSWMGTRCSTN